MADYEAQLEALVREIGADRLAKLRSQVMDLEQAEALFETLTNDPDRGLEVSFVPKETSAEPLEVLTEPFETSGEVVETPAESFESSSEPSEALAEPVARIEALAEPLESEVLVEPSEGAGLEEDEAPQPLAFDDEDGEEEGEFFDDIVIVDEYDIDQKPASSKVQPLADDGD